MHSDCIFIAIISIIIRSPPSPSFESSVIAWHPRAWWPLWRTHKPHSLSASQFLILDAVKGVCGGLFLTAERQRESGEDGQWGWKKKKKKKKEREDNCILPQIRWQKPLSLSLSLCLWVSVYANYQNTPAPWQQHQAAKCEAVVRGGEKRGEASPCPSQADMWCSCWAVTRTHHTRLCSVSPSLSTTYMSISLPAATCQHSHQSLCLSASLPESMDCPWSRCRYGCRAQGWGHLPGIHGYISKSGQSLCRALCFCQCSHDLCSWKPTRKAAVPSLMRKYPWPPPLQSQSMGNRKQKFPENLSARCLCWCVWVWEDEGEIKSFPERIPDYPPTEGKNQKLGGRTQEKREKKNNEIKKKKKKARRQFFI